MAAKKDYWFPAKTHGWGWGLPSIWQGWLAYGIAAALLVAGVYNFSPTTRPAAFLVYTWCIVLLFVALSWIKGESPSWRWRK